MRTFTPSRWLRLSGLVLWLSMSGVACGPTAPEQWTEARSIVDDPNVFVVATEPAYPPFEFLTPDQTLTGFDIELMDAIVERLGLEVEYVKIPFDGLIAMLQAETADAAISAMTITEERQSLIDFSRPYFKSGLAIAVRQGSDITTLRDLEGRKIAAKLGTTGAEIANTVPDAQVILFDSTEQTLSDLANGNVDAVINDAPATLGVMAQGGMTGIELVSNLLTEEYYGIGLPQASPNKPFIDQALADLVADGTYARLYRKWFQADPPDLPPEASPAAGSW